MATKPVTLPRPWATNAVYLTGPFAGQPGKVDPGVGVAAEGHRPGANDPTAAEHENWQQNLVTNSWIPWVNSGSSAGAADAHIVETAASGRATLHGLTVTDLVSEIAVSISGANSVASGLPTASITNTTGAPVIRVTTSAAATGNAVTVNMTGAMTGDGVSVIASDTSVGSCFEFSVPAGSTSHGLYGISESANPTAFLRNAGSGNALSLLGIAGATAFVVDAGGAASGAHVTNATTWAIMGDGDTNGGGGLFTGAGLGTGVGAVGGTGAGAYAVQALARNSTAQGAVFAQTHTTATTASRAGYFEGRDSAGGIEAVSAGYYPAILSPDVTAPTYAALFAAPQNAAPTDTSSGSLTYVGGAINSWGQGNFTDGLWRYFHSTAGGWCYGFASGGPSTNSNEGAYTTLATVVIAAGGDAPNVAGRTARLTVSMRASHNAAVVNYCDVQIRDTTAGATVVTRAGTGAAVGAGYYMPAVNVGYTTSIHFEINYTIPATGTRTFVLEFKRSTNMSNVTAMGTLKVEGLY